MHRCVHALGSFGRVRMAGVSGEESALMVVAEAACYSLADLIAAEPLDVLPPHFEGGHDVLGTLHDELLAELILITL